MSPFFFSWGVPGRTRLVGTRVKEVAGFEAWGVPIPVESIGKDDEAPAGLSWELAGSGQVVQRLAPSPQASCCLRAWLSECLVRNLRGSPKGLDTLFCPAHPEPEQSPDHSFAKHGNA